MNWDSKMPPWDLPELEQNASEPNSGSGAGGLDCSVDLKLGGLGDFGLPENWKEESKASEASLMLPPVISPVAAVGSSKRPRGPGNSGQSVACLVDGCKSDLSCCREYHRRHKVCEIHSKTPVVIVGGQEQRFCQQCSRFHLLLEFDEVKRSCRKRLDGHNRRRRKPPPESANTGNLFQNHHGSGSTSYPQIFPLTASDPAWASIVKTEEEATIYSHHQPPMCFVETPAPAHFAGTSHRSFKESKQFPFHDVASSRQPHLSSISASGSSRGGSKMMFSDCALSLLSSNSQIPMGQPLLPSFSYGAAGSQGGYPRSPAAPSGVSPTWFSCSGAEDVSLGTVLLQDGGEGDDLHCRSVFQAGDEGVSDEGPPSPPFSWQ